MMAVDVCVFPSNWALLDEGVGGLEEIKVFVFGFGEKFFVKDPESGDVVADYFDITVCDAMGRGNKVDEGDYGM